MKFWELTLFMILINVFGSALTNSGLFTAMGFTIDPYTLESMSGTQADIETFQGRMNNTISSEITGDDPTSKAFGSVSDSITTSFHTFFDTFSRYILWPAMIMQMVFHIPAVIGYAFTIMFNLIQAIGLFQFITGRSFKDYE
jgi:hypothetical protein